MTIFERLGMLVHRRRWWVIGAWSVLVLVALPLAPRASGVLRAGGFTLDDLESARARTTLERELGLAPSALILVYRSGTLVAGTPAFAAAVTTATRDVTAAPHVTGILSHALASGQVSADGHTAYDIVLLDLPPDSSPDALSGIVARLHAVPGLSVALVEARRSMAMSRRCRRRICVEVS